MIETTAQEIYPACAFVINSDLRQYGRLIEGLENDYTKGNDNYPRNMVKAYQLLNEYKQWNPSATLHESSGVAFSQQGNDNKSAHRTTEWKKKATCHNCGQKGHIRPECPEPKTENDDNKKEDDNNPDKKSSNKKLTLKNKSVQFTNVNDTDEENNEDVCAAQHNFAFDTLISTSDDLRHLLLLDNQSTCDFFCNPKLLKNVHPTPNTMSVKGNGGSITTKKIGYLKNYGDVWFDERAITNILCLKNVKQKYRVTYDS